MIKISHMHGSCCMLFIKSKHCAKHMKQKQTTQNVLLIKKRKTQTLYFIQEQSFIQNNSKTNVEMKDTNQTMDSNDSKITFDDESSLSFTGTQKQLSLHVLHATHNLVFFFSFFKTNASNSDPPGSS